MGELDFNKITVRADHDNPLKGISVEHLSKVWRINLGSSQKKLDVTTQRGVRTDNPKLTRNFVAGDRMLRYKRISEFFFMDTFFETKKAGKLSRGHTCCQLFVTDQVFVYVVYMKLKGELPQAIKKNI